MSLLPTPTPTPAPAPAPTAAPAAPAAGDPPADGGGDPPPSGERPAWLPETAWKDGAVDLAALEGVLTAGNSDADVPASADAYALPTIDGFDHEAAAASPILQVMRNAAFAAGRGQAFFDEQVGAYVAAMTEKAEAATTEEMKKLGSTAEKRVAAVGEWLNKSLPAPLYEAFKGVVTTAAAVEALEALMAGKGGAPAPRGNAPVAPARKTKAEIEAIMQSKAYSGKQSERDPAVIKEVEAWFEAEYKD